MKQTKYYVNISFPSSCQIFKSILEYAQKTHRRVARKVIL